MTHVLPLSVLLISDYNLAVQTLQAFFRLSSGSLQAPAPESTQSIRETTGQMKPLGLSFAARQISSVATSCTKAAAWRIVVLPASDMHCSTGRIAAFLSSVLRM